AKRCAATQRTARRREDYGSSLDPSFVDLVELGELTGEILLALDIEPILIRAAPVGRALAVPAIQPIHDFHPLDHLPEGRKPARVEPAVVAEIDEDLGGARTGPRRRVRHHAAAVRSPPRLVGTDSRAPRRPAP